MGVAHSSDGGAGNSVFPTATHHDVMQEEDTFHCNEESLLLIKTCLPSDTSNCTNLVCYICSRQFRRKHQLLRHYVCAYEECYSDHLDLFQQPVGGDTPPEWVPLLSNLHEMASQAAAEVCGPPMTRFFEGGTQAQITHEENQQWPADDWRWKLADSNPAFDSASTLVKCKCLAGHRQARGSSSSFARRSKRVRSEPNLQPSSFDDEPFDNHQHDFEDAPALDSTCQVCLLSFFLQTSISLSVL